MKSLRPGKMTTLPFFKKNRKKCLQIWFLSCTQALFTYSRIKKRPDCLGAFLAMVKLDSNLYRTGAICQLFFEKCPRILDTIPNCIYNKNIMKITFDPKKNQKNIEERGLSFDRVVEIDFKTAVFREDIRKDYGETRIRLLGKIADRLHVLIFTMVDDDNMRVISFRKANKREVKYYEEETRSRND